MLTFIRTLFLMLVLNTLVLGAKRFILLEENTGIG